MHQHRHHLGDLWKLWGQHFAPRSDQLRQRLWSDLPHCPLQTTGALQPPGRGGREGGRERWWFARHPSISVSHVSAPARADLGGPGANRSNTFCLPQCSAVSPCVPSAPLQPSGFFQCKVFNNPLAWLWLGSLSHHNSLWGPLSSPLSPPSRYRKCQSFSSSKPY